MDIENMKDADMRESLLTRTEIGIEEVEKATTWQRGAFLLVTFCLGVTIGCVPFLFGLDSFMLVVAYTSNTPIVELSHAQITGFALLWSIAASATAFGIFKALSCVTKSLFPAFLYENEASLSQSEQIFAMGDWLGICIGFGILGLKSGLGRGHVLSVIVALTVAVACGFTWMYYFFDEDDGQDDAQIVTVNREETMQNISPGIGLPIMTFFGGAVLGMFLFYFGFLVLLGSFSNMTKIQYIECSVAWSFLSTLATYLVFASAVYMAKGCCATGTMQESTITRCSYSFATGDFVGFCGASTVVDFLYGRDAYTVALATAITVVWVIFMLYIAYCSEVSENEAELQRNQVLPVTEKTRPPTNSHAAILTSSLAFTTGFLVGMVFFVVNTSLVTGTVISLSTLSSSFSELSPSQIFGVSCAVCAATTAVTVFLSMCVFYAIRRCVGCKETASRYAFILFISGTNLGCGLYGCASMNLDNLEIAFSLSMIMAITGATYCILKRSQICEERD